MEDGGAHLQTRKLNAVLVRVSGAHHHLCRRYVSLDLMHASTNM